MKRLLIVAEEDLDGEPVVTADLEAVLQVVKLVDLVGSQLIAVKLEVGVNARLADGLGDDTPSLLQTPQKEHLLGSTALLLGQLQQGRVLVQRRVGGTQAGVAGGVDALGGVVSNQLGRRVVGVQLNLVDGGHDLGAGVVQKLLEVLDSKVGNTDVLNLAGGRELLHFLPGEKRLMSAGLLPGNQPHGKGNQWMWTYQVLMKSQSGRCFDRSLGSVELGQCTRYRST